MILASIHYLLYCVLLKLDLLKRVHETISTATTSPNSNHSQFSLCVAACWIQWSCFLFWWLLLSNDLFWHCSPRPVGAARGSATSASFERDPCLAGQSNKQTLNAFEKFWRQQIETTSFHFCGLAKQSCLSTYVTRSENLSVCLQVVCLHASSPPPPSSLVLWIEI